TNPEMLHLSLLGSHHGWSGFLRGLRFVVLDELHQYRGLFGSHLAMVVRRLRRLAAYYACRPQLIACSATVGNPGEVATRIGGVPFEVIEGSGAARGPRTLLIWQPPELKGLAGERADAGAEAVGVFTALVRRGLGTILFALSRTAAEAMSMQARERLGPALAGRVAPYRSGYSPAQRREIEEGLKRGWLLGVVSTNALEVGIDIGGLDAAVLAGFPGSKASFWQQAGRAGRGARHSLAVYVPLNRVVDSYYVSHPDELLTGPYEDAVVDLANLRVAEPHLVCAAAELPLRDSELRGFSPVAKEAVARALETGALQHADGALVASGSPHREVGLRGGGGELFAISSPTGELGTIDPLHVYREAYPGAVYLHGGARYRVIAVEREACRVRVRRLDEALATEPVMQTIVTVGGRDSEQRLQSGRYTLTVGAGPVTVHQTTVAYRERTLRGARQSRLLPLPAGLAYELPTVAWWTVFPAELRRALEAGDPRRFLSGLHALEHVLPAAVSLRLVCDPRDVVAVYEPAHAALGGPALFLFDDRAGGAGLAVRAAERAHEVLRAAYEIVRGCRCAEGCPACVVSASCWRGYDDAGKAAALALLGEVTALVPEQSVPVRSSRP
ncbi:MAG TPA: Zn-binding domain-containing protein, partial [Dehalococcoidia bacterium]|nr:Zn-binding domain-containing protein [Dehalococcoidia bacterium]